jgi:hypothetical protein
MKKWFIGILFLAAMFSCSKPEKEDELTTAAVKDQVIDYSVYQSNATGSLLTPGQFPEQGMFCNTQKFDFIAGQTVDAGDVFIGNDKEFLYIKITSTDGFQNVEENVKMWIGATMPFTDRPVTGHFPFKYTVPEDGKDLYLRFSLAELGLKCDAAAFYIVIHGDVLAPGSETAFSGDKTGQGNAWWYYLAYTPKCCEPPVECKITASAEVTDVKCHGSSTGAIDLTVVNGTAPLAFLWSNGATTEDLTAVPAGTYSVTVTAADKCFIVVKDIVVNQPENALSATSQVTNISVFGAKDGSISITPAGGKAPYTFKWSNEATTEDLSGLEPGTYSVEITDANSCVFVIRELLVQQPDEEKPKGLIAYARKTYEPMVYCFSNLDLDHNGTPDFTNIGWTNGPIPLENYTSKYELFTGMTNCSAADGVKVGEMKIAASIDGTAVVTIEMAEGYTLNETDLFIGNTMLPKDGSNNFTTNPEFYTYKHPSLAKVSTDTYSVSGLSGDIYVVAFALVNKP